MKPKISIITIGVNDLEKMGSFYRDGLGLPVVHGEFENIIFFEMEGTWLSLYSKVKLAEDVGISAEGSGFSGVTLAHNVSSEEKVNEVIEIARKAGAKILKEPQKVFWGGYSGYFEDPEGNLWEVAYNPYTDLS